jgi:EAL domain-containing protein (putative c-di-GMP-specific phosphodiesterase class I)
MSRVLVVDDESDLRSLCVDILQDAGLEAEGAADGEAATQLIFTAGATRPYDVIVSDVSMPRMSGLDLLRRLRERDLDVPLILMTGGPSLDAAIQAVEYGAFRYLLKPFKAEVLVDAVMRAARMHALARLKREAAELQGGAGLRLGDRAALEIKFGDALKGLWMAYQPIVDVAARGIYAYEALVRTEEPSLARPPDLLEAAERLERLPDLGRAIRARVAADAPAAPAGVLLFVNLHPADLQDDELFDPQAALTSRAAKVVLEVTERSSLEGASEISARIRRLRALGYRLAVDDLGAGYAGLGSMAQLEPEVVKLDMGLVRGIHEQPRRRELVGGMVALCHQMGMQVIAEGVEVEGEMRALAELGCALQQGYFYCKPGRAFPQPRLPD